MRRSKWVTKAVAIVCLLALIVCGLPGAAMAADEDLDAKIERLRAELSEINSNIAGLESELNDAAALKNYYKQQQETLEELLASNKESIASTERMVSQKQSEISDKMESIYANQALFEERMVAVYKNRNEGVLSTLLSVNSFSELLTVSNSLQRITKHDTELIQTLSREKEELDLERQELEALIDELNAKNEENQQGIEALATNISAQDAAISDVEAKRAAEQEVLGDVEYTLDQALAEQAAQIALAAELAAEAAERERQRQAEEDARNAEKEENENNENGEEGEDGDGDSGVTPEPPPHNGSVYQWPVPGFYNVSCEFGQPDPLGIPHRGMDINGAGIHGAAVVAAGPGTVIRAGVNSSYGNYVSIDHGNGVVTLYAHLDSIGGSVNQYVEAGTYIGAVGSTGFSTGYHLHFEVQVNGALQNPRSYVSP